MIAQVGAVKNERDWRNKEKKRSANNTSRDLFNCGGYALNTINWYCPYENQMDGYRMFEEWEYLGEDSELCYMLHEKTKLMVDHILKDFDDIRLIESVEDLQEGEYGVAFRTGISDFHFAKYIPQNGKWIHKPGSQPIEELSEEEVFNKVWYNPLFEEDEIEYHYNGEMILFAKIA